MPLEGQRGDLPGRDPVFNCRTRRAAPTQAAYFVLTCDIFAGATVESKTVAPAGQTRGGRGRPPPRRSPESAPGVGEASLALRFAFPLRHDAGGTFSSGKWMTAVAEGESRRAAISMSPSGRVNSQPSAQSGGGIGLTQQTR